jgi:hypothetical protein
MKEGAEPQAHTSECQTSQEAEAPRSTMSSVQGPASGRQGSYQPQLKRTRGTRSVMRHDCRFRTRSLMQVKDRHGP